MSINLKHIILIFLFLFLQIIWFNQLNLFGKYTPVIYLYPFLLLPIGKDESFNLFLGFTAGLLLDIVTGTGGVFAATTVLLLYLKKFYFLVNKSPSQDITEMQISNLSIPQKLVYFGIYIFLGLFFIHLFDSFSFRLVLSKLGYVSIGTLISLFFYIFIDAFFFNKQD